MTLVVDQDHRGTPEAAWLASPRLTNLAPLQWTHPRRIVVVSPHPDDETLGAGGLLQLAASWNVPIEIVAVTDGERSHEEPDFDLRSVRWAETREALGRLGLPHIPRRRLQLPDGDVAAHVDVLAAEIADTLQAGDLCLAPWSADGHPDHDACGRAACAARESTGAHLLSFLVWAWHWANPEGSEIPWPDCRMVHLPRRVTARKRWSTGAFVSQTRPAGCGGADNAILPPHVLRRFFRPFEVFVEQKQ